MADALACPHDAVDESWYRPRRWRRFRCYLETCIDCGATRRREIRFFSTGRWSAWEKTVDSSRISGGAGPEIFRPSKAGAVLPPMRVESDDPIVAWVSTVRSDGVIDGKWWCYDIGEGRPADATPIRKTEFLDLMRESRRLPLPKARGES